MPIDNIDHSKDPTYRNIGDSGLSVGTHIPIERIFPKQFKPYGDIEPTTDVIKLSKYSFVFFNALTLLRNILGSFVYKDKDTVIAKNDIGSLLVNEIEILKNLFEDKNYVYLPNYDKVLKVLNSNKKTDITTKDQQHNLYYSMLKGMVKSKHIRPYIDSIDHVLPKPSGDVLVFTSYPIDLLNRGRFSLLESNTGKVKTEKDFYTKFHSLGKEDLSDIPFTIETVYMFGTSNLIKPLPLNTRREIYKISKEKHWTYKTTSERIRMNLKTNKEYSNILNNIKPLY